MNSSKRPAWRKVKIRLRHAREVSPVRIISDAAIASALRGDGRLIPLLIIDCSNRPDVEEMLRIHAHLAPGDVEIQWGRIRGHDKVSLLLSFIRPLELNVILDFDIIQQGGLVDLIIR